MACILMQSGLNKQLLVIVPQLYNNSCIYVIFYILNFSKVPYRYVSLPLFVRVEEPLDFNRKIVSSAKYVVKFSWYIYYAEYILQKLYSHICICTIAQMPFALHLQVNELNFCTFICSFTTSFSICYSIHMYNLHICSCKFYYHTMY